VLDHRLVLTGSFNKHPDESRDVESQLFRVHHGVVALDQIALAQFAHAVTDAGYAESHFVRYFNALDPSRVLQEAEDLGVSIVYSPIHGRIQGMMATIRKGPPLPPAIFMGSAITVKSSAGSVSRFATFSNTGILPANSS